MSDRDILGEMNKKLDSLQRDVNDIQGDVRMQTKIHRDTNRGEIKNQIHESFGESEAKRLIWYHADGKSTASELAETIDMAPATVSRNATDLAESGVIDRVKDGNNVYYQRAEITEGLGIEGEVAEELDL